MAPPCPLGTSPCNPSPLQRAAATKQSSLTSTRSSLPRQRSCWSEDTSATHGSQASSTARFLAGDSFRSFCGASSSPRTIQSSRAREARGEGFAPRVVQGFVLSEGHSPAAAETLGISNVTGTAGLLSRQLSQRLGHNCDATGISASQDARQTQNQKEDQQQRQRLEQCLEKHIKARPPSVKPTPSWSDSLLATLQERHLVFKAPVVKAAFSVAASAFSFQQQLQLNSKVAIILADLRLDADTVAATLLYGVLDATPTTAQQLRKLLPPNVCELIGAASRIDRTCALLQTDHTVKEDYTAAHLTSMLLAMADVKAVLMVLANKLQHMRSGAAAAASGGADLRVEATEGLRIFAPLANRLGVWKLKAELEDLCFMVLEPHKAKELQQSLAKPQSLDGLNEALTLLKARLDSDKVAYKDLTGRPKNLYGVHQKLRRKGFFAEVSDIHDVRGLRLIVDSKQDCWAALRAVESLWRPIPRRYKDYIRHPKANGYQSLHTVVRASDGLPLEVQIRTSKMHYIAEYGVAAHWRYKEVLGGDVSGHTDRIVGWSRWLITWHMELEDGKCRPRGSPPRDTSLSDQFPAPFSPATPSTDSAPGDVCAFPQHASDCRFSNFVQSDHFAPRAAAADAVAPPVYVILLGSQSPAGQTACSTGSCVEADCSLTGAVPARLGSCPLAPTTIHKLPAGTTVGDLMSGSIPGVAATYSPADVAAGLQQPQLRVSVNRQQVDDTSLPLSSGDEVEILQVAEPVPPPSPTCQSHSPISAPISAPAPAGNILPTGGLGKQLAASRASATSGSEDGGSSRPRSQQHQQQHSSPVNESAFERDDRIGRSRQAISRLYGGPPAAKPLGVRCSGSSWDEQDSEARSRAQSGRDGGSVPQSPPLQPHMRPARGIVAS